MDSNWELIKKKGRNLAAIELLASPQLKMGKYGRSNLPGPARARAALFIWSIVVVCGVEASDNARRGRYVWSQTGKLSSS